MAVDEAARLDPGDRRQIAARYARIQIGRVVQMLRARCKAGHDGRIVCAQLQILQ